MALYALTSLIVAFGYKKRLLGSSDVVYFGLFLGAGVYLTGGAFSPVIYIFFGLSASYLLLSSPKAFVSATAASSVAIIVAVVMVEAGITLGGLT